METTVEIIFNGTPAEFGVMADEFGIATFRQLGACVFMYNGGLTPSTDQNPVLVTIGKAQRLYARAHKLPGGNSRVMVSGFAETWEAAGDFWEMLLAEMRRQGWVDGGGQQTGALPIPENLLVSLPGNRGSNKWWTAYFDWEMEYKKQHRWTNRDGYELLGYGKSEYDRKKGLWKAEHGAK